MRGAWRRPAPGLAVHEGLIPQTAAPPVSLPNLFKRTYFPDEPEKGGRKRSRQPSKGQHADYGRKQSDTPL